MKDLRDYLFESRLDEASGIDDATFKKFQRKHLPANGIYPHSAAKKFEINGGEINNDYVTEFEYVGPWDNEFGFKFGDMPKLGKIKLSKIEIDDNIIKSIEHLFNKNFMLHINGGTINANIPGKLDNLILFNCNVNNLKCDVDYINVNNTNGDLSNCKIKEFLLNCTSNITLPKKIKSLTIRTYGTSSTMSGCDSCDIVVINSTDLELVSGLPKNIKELTIDSDVFATNKSVNFDSIKEIESIKTVHLNKLDSCSNIDEIINYLSEMGVKDLYVDGRKADSKSGNTGQSLKQASEDLNVIYANPNISDLDPRIEKIFDRRYEEIGDNVKIKDFEKMGCNILITKMYDKYIHIEFCKDRKLLVSFNKGGTGSTSLRVEDYSGSANKGQHHFLELDDPSYKYIKSYKVDPNDELWQLIINKFAKNKSSI